MRPFNHHRNPGDPKGAGAAVNGFTLLLVDDDPQVSGFVAASLSPQGYRIVTARDSDHALRLSESRVGPIHLLITDQVMPPFMSGHELATCLRLLRPEMKVLYISGYVATDGVVDELGDAGADFLAKPFSPRDLVAKVAALVAGEDPETDPDPGPDPGPEEAWAGAEAGE